MALPLMKRFASNMDAEVVILTNASEALCFGITILVVLKVKRLIATAGEQAYQW